MVAGRKYDMQDIFMHRNKESKIADTWNLHCTVCRSQSDCQFIV